MDDEASAKTKTTALKTEAPTTPDGIWQNGEVKMTEPAPWAVENCPACKGCGLNSKGAPCKVCVSKSPKGAPKPDVYAIVVEDGFYIVLPTGEAAPAPAAAAPVKRGPGRPRKTAEPEPEPPDDVEKPSPGRPKGMPLLLINCTLESGDDVIDLNEVFEFVGQQIAQHEGKNTFYEVDTWHRRELFALVAEKIADKYRNKWVRCCTANPDKVALVDALGPYSRVIRGVL